MAGDAGSNWPGYAAWFGSDMGSITAPVGVGSGLVASGWLWLRGSESDCWLVPSGWGQGKGCFDIGLGAGGLLGLGLLVPAGPPG